MALQRIFILVMLTLLSWAGLFSSGRKEYINPVWNMSAPDPTVVRGPDGYFYAYTTQGLGPDSVMCNIQLLRSRDLVEWIHLGDALPEKPTWAFTTQDFWAPHVMEKDGHYILYYSAEPDADVKKGKDLGLCIGVAVAPTPAGPFKDTGRPLLEGDGFINIDPMSFCDPVSGRNYLYWGSGFEPLKVRALAADCLGFEEGSETIELIKPFGVGYQFLVEGSWVHYRDGWYYLFYSGDNCCGERAHYAVMVARSKSPTGPFEVLCREEEGDYAILEANERWIAPGHNCIVKDDDGQDWIVYHAIDPKDRWTYRGQKREDKRVMLLDRIVYKDGWPTVETNSPSSIPSSTPLVTDR